MEEDREPPKRSLEIFNLEEEEEAVRWRVTGGPLEKEVMHISQKLPEDQVKLTIWSNLRNNFEKPIEVPENHTKNANIKPISAQSWRKSPAP
jgi:hypothetical protein